MISDTTTLAYAHLLFKLVPVAGLPTIHPDVLEGRKQACRSTIHLNLSFALNRIIYNVDSSDHYCR